MGPASRCSAASAELLNVDSMRYSLGDGKQRGSLGRRVLKGAQSFDEGGELGTQATSSGTA